MYGRSTIGVLLACTFLGCGVQDVSEGPPAAPEVPAIGPGTVASADGVEIAYTVHRVDRPALLLVHGWMCDQSYWDEQVAGLVERFGVVTVDVAGHGTSAANRENWTISSLGSDVGAVIKKLHLDDVIVVGHSMGGLVALEAARQMPGAVIGVIGVDTLHDVDAERDVAGNKKFLDALREDFKPTCDGFVRSMSVEGTEPALVDRIAIDMCSGPAEVGAALIQAYVDYDHAQALADAEVPIRVINADLWPTDVAGNQELADFEATIFAGRGHFLMQEAAEELTDSITEDALEILAAESTRNGSN